MSFDWALSGWSKIRDTAVQKRPEIQALILECLGADCCSGIKGLCQKSKGGLSIPLQDDVKRLDLAVGLAAC